MRQPEMLYGPEFDEELSGIERRRKLSEALMANSMQPLQGRQAGRFYVAPSPLEGLAKAVGIWGGMRGAEKADKERQGVVKRAQSSRADALAKALEAAQGAPEIPGGLSEMGDEITLTQPGRPGNPMQAMQMLAQASDPMLQQVGMKGLVGQMTPYRPNQNIAKLNPRDFTPDSWAAYVQGGDTTKLRPTATPNALMSNDMQRQQLQAKLFMWQNLSPAQRADLLRDLAKFNLDAQKFGFETGQQVPPLTLPPEVSGGAPQLPAGLPGAAPQGAQTPAQFPRGAAAGEDRGAQLRILQAELAQTQDPELRAGLEREIARAGGMPQAAPAPMAGGNADRGVPALSPKQLQAREAERPEAQKALNLVSATIDDALASISNVEKQPGLSRVTGPIASKTWTLSAEGANAESDIAALKAQLSGIVLQKMRDASKTGGAVGQVTEREWPRLESFLGNLNTVQTTEQFKKRLAEVKERLNKIKVEMQRAYNETYGGPKPAADGWSDL